MAQVKDGVVAVTGATGFVGRHVVRELLSRGHRVRALVRGGAKAREVLPISGELELVVGDVLEERSLDELLRGAWACVHLVGILREGPGGRTFRRMHVDATRAVVGACGRWRVGRLVHLSALGSSPEDQSGGGVCEYQRTKFEGERVVMESPLAWTIFRPGLIHGEGSEFLGMMKGLCSGLEAPYVFIPYFTGGREDKRVPLGGVEPTDARVAPVGVEDVARAIGLSLEKEGSIGEVYNLVGAEAYAWPALVEMIRDGTHGNGNLRPWGIPAKMASGAAKVAKMVGLGRFLPFDEGMPLMAAQDSVAERWKARRHLGLETKGFRAEFARYAGRL